MPNTSIMGNRMTTVKTVSGVDIVLGLWLIISPFILGYGNAATPMWNSVIVGVGVAILSGVRTTNDGVRQSWLSWVNVILGAWLLFSPFILGFADNVAALWNNIILGATIAVLAAWGALISTSRNNNIDR
ncbi:MAG TPA: SPW repeat protein [Patescibacteria group bacterium]|nr:SPW repeat protein [Patescibacteria group bacterium]